MRGHHYFFVAQRKDQYVAAITFSEPKDGKVPEKEYIIGTIHAAAVQSPVQLRAWCDLMSKASDDFINFVFQVMGEDNAIAGTETIFNRIPGVN